MVGKEIECTKKKLLCARVNGLKIKKKKNHSGSHGREPLLGTQKILFLYCALLRSTE